MRGFVGAQATEIWPGIIQWWWAGARLRAHRAAPPAKGGEDSRYSALPSLARPRLALPSRPGSASLILAARTDAQRRAAVLWAPAAVPRRHLMAAPESRPRWATSAAKPAPADARAAAGSGKGRQSPVCDARSPRRRRT